MRADGFCGGTVDRRGVKNASFVVIEGLNRRGGRERAEALLAAAGALAKYSGESAHPLGISVGLALAEPPLRETPEQFVARADAAMYCAKQSGKGTIVEALPAGTAAA